jgi:hypothetical protein
VDTVAYQLFARFLETAIRWRNPPAEAGPTMLSLRIQEEGRRSVGGAWLEEYRGFYIAPLRVPLAKEGLEYYFWVCRGSF